MATVMMAALVRSATRSALPWVPRAGLRTSAPAMETFTVQDKDDFKFRVLQNKRAVLVDFHASWCGPCKMLGPRLEAEVATRKERVHLAKVDIDVSELSELAMKYEVSAVPTVVAFKGGKVIDKFVGVLDADKLKSFVDKVQAAPKQ